MLSHRINKVSQEISHISWAIFFVNVFSAGRNFFATILATHISSEAVQALAFSLAIIMVVNMIVFGILSLIGSDFSHLKTRAEQQEKTANYRRVCFILSVLIIVFLSALYAVMNAYGKLSALNFVFMMTYAIAFVPFIYSSALRYMLLAHGHTAIIKLTNVITFALSVIITVICYIILPQLSIVCFAIGVLCAFIYNVWHLSIYAYQKKILLVDKSAFFSIRLHDFLMSVRFIYQGVKVAFVYASDAMFSALIIMFTLHHNHEYILAVQVSLQLFMLASFWITGFANAIMIILPKNLVFQSSRKAFAILIYFILKACVRYMLIVAAVAIVFLYSIFADVFSLSGQSLVIARQEVYLILLLVGADFIRQTLFYILRSFKHMNYAIMTSYGVYVLAGIVIAILNYHWVTPVSYIVVYILASLAIALIYFRCVSKFKFKRG